MLLFNNINEWGKKKLRLVNLAFLILYYIFATAIPVIITICKYDLFNSNKGFKLSGMALIIIIVIGTIAIKKLFEILSNFPHYTRGEQLFKFSVLMLGSLSIPVLIQIALSLIQDNMNLAIDTIKWCVFSYMLSIVINWLILKPFSVQWELIKAKEKNNAIDKIKL